MKALQHQIVVAEINLDLVQIKETEVESIVDPVDLALVVIVTITIVVAIVALEIEVVQVVVAEALDLVQDHVVVQDVVEIHHAEMVAAEILPQEEEEEEICVADAIHQIEIVIGVILPSIKALLEDLVANQWKIVPTTAVAIKEVAKIRIGTVTGLVVVIMEMAKLTMLIIEHSHLHNHKEAPLHNVILE